jgi:hypothetical protein
VKKKWAGDCFWGIVAMAYGTNIAEYSLQSAFKISTALFEQMSCFSLHSSSSSPNSR